MRQIPLRGGPFDGATVPANEVINGRYIAHRVSEAPQMTFDPNHDPAGPIDDALPAHETVVYERRGAGANRWLEFVRTEA